MVSQGGIGLRATPTLPAGYIHAGRIEPKRGHWQLTLVTVFGTILMCLVSTLFVLFLTNLRPNDADTAMVGIPFNAPNNGIAILYLFLMIALTVPLHEAIHGLAFRFLTGSRPRYTLRRFFAAAGLPGLYLPRDTVITAALAPFALITLACVLVFAFTPGGFTWPAMMLAAFNGAGSIGDLMTVIQLLRHPRETLVHEEEGEVRLFRLRKEE